MGNLFSVEEDEQAGLDQPQAREQLQQRQRAQVLLLSQLRQEAAGGPAALGLRPMQQPSLRQTQVFKNPLHVRAKSVQLACTLSPDGVEQWTLSFIFDALVPCEVLVHVGLGCSLEVRSPLPLPDQGGTPVPEVVVGEGSAKHWVSQPTHFREGLNQEYRGAIDLGDFLVTKAAPESTDDTPDTEGPLSLRTRQRTQGFCIEIKSAESEASRRSSSLGTQGRDSSIPRSQRDSPRPRLNSSAESGNEGREDLAAPRGREAESTMTGRAVEWTTGRFVRRDCSQSNLALETSGEVVEAKILSQSVKLPNNQMAPCYSMYEVFGADGEGGEGGSLTAQDCAICMSERRDTAVLPCRHMCLCSGCAETMRTQIQYHSYRCPICRERVSSLLQVRAEEP